MVSELVIYPTARKVRQALKERSRVGPVVGYAVMTLPELVDRLWQETVQRRSLLSPMAQRLAQLEVGAQGFGLGPGTAWLAGTLVDEFKSAAIQPRDLDAASAGLGAAERARVQMIARLWERYETHLETSMLCDRHDRERQVLEMLHRAETEGSRPRMLKDVQRVVVTEIYDFGLLQFMILACLIRIVGDATVTIQAQPRPTRADRFAELTWNRFVQEESIADRILPSFARRGGRHGQINYLLEHIFEDPARSLPAPPPYDGTIAIIEAPSRRQEADEVARAVRRALAGEDCEPVRLDRITLVARDLAPYADHLREAFGRYRIPLELNPRSALLGCQAAALALTALRLPALGYRREDLERLLASPLVYTSAGRYRSLLTRLRYIDRPTQPLAHCIALRRAALEERLAAEKSDELSHRRATAERDRLNEAAHVFDELLALLGQLEPSATVAEYARRLIEVLQRLGVTPVGGDPGSPDAQAIAALLRVLSDLAAESRQLGLSRQLNAQEFAALLQAVLAEPDLSEDAAASEPAVAAMPILEARGLDFDLVIIMGLNEGELPRHLGDDPLLPDTLRVMLNPRLQRLLARRFGDRAPGFIGRILRTRRDRNSEDWFLFFLALSMAEKRTILSYSATTADGQPMLPSPFVTEVTRLLGSAPGSAAMVRRIAAHAVIPDLGDCFERSEFLGWAAANGKLGQGWAGGLTAPGELESIVTRTGVELHRERYFEAPSREEAQVAGSGADAVARMGQAGAFDGRLEAGARLRQMLLGASANPAAWSATSLNELAQCGFRFFAARVLRLHELETIEREQAPPETGTMVHEVLRAFFTARPDLKDLDGALGTARAILADSRARLSLLARDLAFFDIAWTKVERAVEELVAFEVERRLNGEPEPTVIEHEVPFDLQLDAQSLGSEQTTIAVRLSGRIDRAELYRGHDDRIECLRVLDYKFSSQRAAYAKSVDPKAGRFGVTEFQLAVYLIGLMHKLQRELVQKPVVRGGYLVLRHHDKLVEQTFEPAVFATDPEKRSRLVQAGIEPLADRIAELVATAIDGRFDVDPLQCDGYCPYWRLCRFPRSAPIRGA